MSAVREEQPERDFHPMLAGRAHAAKRRAPSTYDDYEELKKDFQTDYSFMVNLVQDQPAGEVILDMLQLPEDWDHSESDSDVNDYDAPLVRIPKRCIPCYFEEWNDEHVSKKQKREEICLECPQKDDHSSLRVYELLQMKNDLQMTENVEAIVNVQAIIEAYKNKTLKWTPRLVTYWADGIRLCMPRPFAWDEFELIRDESGGCHEDAWVEPVEWNSGLLGW